MTPQNIPVVLSGCPLNHNQHNKRCRETCGVNYNNLISIQITKAKTSQNRATLPIICCLNARSLNGKVDELTAFMSVHKVHIATVTETWLTDQIGDDQLSIGGYVIYRKDRMHGRGGGVCAYVSQQIPTIRCLELEVSNLECM